MSLRTVFDRTVRRVAVAARDRAVSYLERRNGIDTSEEIHLKALGLEGEGRGRYKPASWFTLRRILPRRDVSHDDVFLDVGSGMGRAVYQAAQRYRFRRVVGVELSEELNQVAQKNIERNRHRLRCTDIELVTADIVDYEVPDDVTVVFLNNPFVGELFAVAIRKLIASIDRRPRSLRVIYCNPKEHGMLVGTGRFKPVRRLRGLRPGEEWARSNSTRMYEVLPVDHRRE